MLLSFLLMCRAVQVGKERAGGIEEQEEKREKEARKKLINYYLAQWELHSDVMSVALELHNTILRAKLQLTGGYP